MFVAIMVLSLGSSFAFLAFQVSTTELAISKNSEGESTAQYLAESGVEKVLSWASSPSASPKPTFFDTLLTTPCSGTQDDPDFPNTDDPPSPPDFSSYLLDPSSGPFSELKDVGKIVDLRLYAPIHPEGICTVEVEAETNTGASKRVRVHITANPLGRITAGIQGDGNPLNPSPVWVHWGAIRYLGQANLGEQINKVPILDDNASPIGNPYLDDPDNYDLNIDPNMTLDVQELIVTPVPDDGDTFIDRENVRQDVEVALDDIDLERLKSFIKKNGEYYTVSADGQHLLKNGKHRIVDGLIADKTFDEIFDGKIIHYHLVWIDNHDSPLLEIQAGRLRGYFYFSGGIRIKGNVSGMTRTAKGPDDHENETESISLTDINLDGLFYVQDQVVLQDHFTTYGAIFSKNGFSGPGANDLEVWYNADFGASIYSGIRRVTPLIGTWINMPAHES